jgi:hypothetical protein
VGRTWSAIIASVAPVFTRPSFAIFADLVAGWVLTPGRRTITRIIDVIDPDGRCAHDAYHRLVRDGVWRMDGLWATLAVAIVEKLIEADVAVVLDLDDTVHHKTGRRIEGGGIFRDAVRSTRNRIVYGLGPKPGGDHHPREPAVGRDAARAADQRPDPTQGRGSDHRRARPADADRDRFLAARANLPARLRRRLRPPVRHEPQADAGDLRAASRRDTAVYELTPPHTGNRSRPRKKGERLTALAAMAAATPSWRTVTFDQRGTRRSWTPTPWYASKSHTPFADALASLRVVLWRERITPVCSHEPLPADIRDQLIHVLAQAA